MNGISGTKARHSLKIFLMAGCSALLLASCAPKVDTDAIAKKLTQLDEDWSKTAATKNADSVASYYAADAIAYPPDSPIAAGHDAAKKVWADGFADSTYKISWKTSHAGASQGGDMGFTAGTYEESMRGPTGAQVTNKGKYVCLWAKQADGSWKAVHDIWNADSK
jgi:ketosteroid isomerase-like protein